MLEDQSNEHALLLTFVEFSQFVEDLVGDWITAPKTFRRGCISSRLDHGWRDGRGDSGSWVQPPQ